MREEADTSTVRPFSSSTGRWLNSATLRTGPSHDIAMSGSRWYAPALRAYSTADTTETSSSPATSRPFSSVGEPVTSSPSSGTTPRSIAP